MAASRVLAGWFLVTLCAIGQVNAQDVDPPKRTTVGVLTDTQAANILKAAQLEGAELDKKIREAGKAGDAGASQASASSTPSVSNNAAQASTPPVVRAVAGSNGVLVATFVYVGGQTADGKKGDKLPYGYVIKELTPDRYTLCRSGECFEATLSDQAPVDQTAQKANQGGLFPPNFVAPPSLH